MDYKLQQRLDAFVRGELGAKPFIDELCAVCAEMPDFAWEVLAITDQYHRRGKISAGLNQRIRFAIVRPALARQTAAFADASPMAPTAQVAAPDEMQALRRELNASNRTLHRYRARHAKVVAFARKRRDDLAEARRELKSSRVRSLVPLAPEPHAAPDLALAAWGAASNRTVREEPRPESRRVRPSHLAAAIALFLTVMASPTLRDALITGAVAPAVAAPKEASALGVAPGLHEVQKVSLDDERYVIRPGDHQALIRVRRTGGFTGKVSFTWWTRPSSAKSGADYWGRLPALEQFPEGADALTLSVPIIANPRRIHTELFYVAIGNPGGGAVIGAIHTSAVIIMPKS